MHVLSDLVVAVHDVSVDSNRLHIHTLSPGGWGMGEGGLVLFRMVETGSCVALPSVRLSFSSCACVLILTHDLCVSGTLRDDWSLSVWHLTG